jgi:hypothetical protein
VGTWYLAFAITEVAGSVLVKPNRIAAKPGAKAAYDNAVICLRVRPELSNSVVDPVEISENFFTFCELKNSS